MKVGFILLLFYTHNVLCGQLHQSAKGFLTKKDPKILLSKRVFKPTYLNRDGSKSKKFNKLNKKEYTVFSHIGAPKVDKNVPESPIFRMNPFEQRKRIKKISPDYDTIVGIRRKRNVEPKKENKKGNLTEITDAKAKNKKLKVPLSKGKLTAERKKKSLKKLKVDKADKRKGHKHQARRHSKSLKTRKHHGRKSAKNKKSKAKIGKSHRKTGKKTVLKTVEETRRLTTAKDALIEDFPYTVSIQKNDEHWCSGALVNPRLVITTANCIWKASRLSRLEVRAGSRYLDRGGQRARIQEAMKHPNWSIRGGPDNDVAFLLLDRLIRFSDSVHGVDIPNIHMVPAFDDAWVTSWGAERRDGIYDKKTMTLQSYHAQLMDREKCNNVTKRFGITVSENFICLTQAGHRAPCTRDTGAPAVSDGVLWGLASWGIRKLCGTERFPAMFSYLGSHSNMVFIANATRILMADERFNPFLDRIH